MACPMVLRGRLFRGVIFLAWLMTAVLGIAHAQAGELVLIDQGQSDYVIALAEPAASDEPLDTAKLTEAGMLLQASLKAATGVTLPVVMESQKRVEAPAIYLGRTQAARRQGIDVQAITRWSYHLRVIGSDVYLVGQDLPGDGVVGGFSGYSGTTKAVTAFLQKYAGVRYTQPGSWGTYIPKLDRLAIEDTLDEHWTQPLEFILGRRVAPDSRQESVPYAVANSFFGKYGSDSNTVWIGGSHTWKAFVPREQYLETHPEYFGLFKGKRDPTKRNILCLSNPDVKDLLVKGVTDKMDEGYQMVMLGQADGYIECQCDACQAIHPDIGEKLWIFHRQIVQRIHELRPGKQVILLSYVTTTKPPLTFDQFPPNVVIMNNRYTPEYFQAWQSFDTPRAVYFPEWLQRWPIIPFRLTPPRYVVNLVRRWRENRVVGVYLGGGLDSSHSAWGLNGPAYYAFGQALNDPAVDADDTLRQYTQASFGSAAEPMLSFFQSLYRRLEVVETFVRRETGNPDRRYRGYSFEMYPGDYMAHFYPPQLLNQLREDLDKALEMAGDEKARAHVTLVRSEFAYLEQLARTYHVFRAYESQPSWPLFDALHEQVKLTNQVVEGLRASAQAEDQRHFKDLRQAFNTGWPMRNKLGPINEPPFDWDFDAIRQSGQLPRPVYPPRLVGGQDLEPYNTTGLTQQGTGDRGEKIDPQTGAPVDQ